MNLTNALGIHGWMSEVELTWLARRAAAAKNIAEIGCWQGRSTRAMADNSPAIIWAVDTWEGTPNEHEIFTAEQKKDFLFHQFSVNLAGQIASGRVVPVRLPSIEAASRLDGECFDMIFIDAAHDYDNVKADIMAWKPLLAPKGLLCGHDYDRGRPGVLKAVRELLPGHKYSGAGSIWLYQS